MHRLLRPRIWPSSLSSSDVGPCDVPLRYGNQSRGTAGRLPGGTPIFFALAALRSAPQAGSQFRGLATAIHEISGLVVIAKVEEQFGSSFHESNVYLIIESLVLWARSRFNDFVGNDNERFWSIGVLECWSVGKRQSPRSN